MGSLAKPKSIFILVTVLVFFVFLLNMFLNSFPADYRIFLRDTGSYYSTGSLMPLFHLAGELTGEVGVILRFVGVCILLTFAVTLAWKKSFSWSLLTKAVLLEGIYYAFNIVFIVYLFVKGNVFANYGAATSFLTQILFVTPIFVTLYLKLKNKNFDNKEITKWGALASIGFIFALWSKHFLLALYALPLNLSNPVFFVGFLNSVLTFLTAGIIMIAVLRPLYMKKSSSFNTKGFGAALIIAGLYAIVFVGLALFSPEYRSWIPMIDWWTFAFVIMGTGFLTIKKVKTEDTGRE